MWLRLFLILGMLWGLNEAGIAASQWVRYSSSQYQVFYIQPSFTKKKGSRYHVLLRYETKPESTRWARRGPFYVKDEVRLFEMDQNSFKHGSLFF
jgi:hypothetical protein